MRYKIFSGVSMIEVILAMAVFVTIAVSAQRMFGIGYRGIVHDSNYMQAVFHAQEGIEVVRVIGDQDWENLDSGTYGIELSGGDWELVGLPQELNGLTRTIIISDVYRDSDDVISDTSGVIDPDIKKIRSTVEWEWIEGQSKEVVFSSYLTNGE